MFHLICCMVQIETELIFKRYHMRDVYLNRFPTKSKIRTKPKSAPSASLAALQPGVVCTFE